MTRYRILERHGEKGWQPFAVAYERDGRIVLFAPPWRADQTLNAATLDELSDQHSLGPDFGWRAVETTAEAIRHPIELLRRSKTGRPEWEGPPVPADTQKEPARSEVYLADVAITLNNLGLVQRDLNDLQAARQSFERALHVYRRLARDHPEIYQPNVAMTLNHLGTIQRDLHDLQAARHSFEEALAVYSQLATQHT